MASAGSGVSSSALPHMELLEAVAHGSDGHSESGDATWGQEKDGRPAGVGLKLVTGGIDEAQSAGVTHGAQTSRC